MRKFKNAAGCQSGCPHLESNGMVACRRRQMAAGRVPLWALLPTMPFDSNKAPPLQAGWIIIVNFPIKLLLFCALELKNFEMFKNTPRVCNPAFAPTG